MPINNNVKIAKCQNESFIRIIILLITSLFFKIIIYFIIDNKFFDYEKKYNVFEISFIFYINSN